MSLHQRFKSFTFLHDIASSLNINTKQTTGAAPKWLEKKKVQSLEGANEKKSQFFSNGIQCNPMLIEQKSVVTLSVIKGKNNFCNNRRR